MKSVQGTAFVFILLMILSAFTIITPLDSAEIHPLRPEDKINDALLNSTSSPEEVDVLVSYDALEGVELESAQSFAAKYGEVIEVYQDLNMMRVKILGTSLIDLAKSAWVSNIWPNEALGVKTLESSEGTILSDDEYESIVDLVGARDLWDMGYNGSGIVMAVLSTGIDSSHPDLDDFDDNESTTDTKVAAYASFVEADALPSDILGPGTYAASVAAGTGNASDGQYSGIAPGATLLAGKVTLGGILALPSWIVSGIEWASTNG
ncbi:MAG: S8 family serine peptidase, partial [Candidatus Thorarchaeota archaeon]